MKSVRISLLYVAINSTALVNRVATALTKNGGEIGDSFGRVVDDDLFAGVFVADIPVANLKSLKRAIRTDLQGIQVRVFSVPAASSTRSLSVMPSTRCRVKLSTPDSTGVMMEATSIVAQGRADIAEYTSTRMKAPYSGTAMFVVKFYATVPGVKEKRELERVFEALVHMAWDIDIEIGWDDDTDETSLAA